MAQYTQINPDALVTALTPINNSLGGKQDKIDNTLATTDKTISGAINEINTKVGNLTGALTWKGKFDTLPAVTDYEAGNVVGVGNKEYVLTVTGSTKAWEELGDEGSYLLKSVAEETYLKKADGAVTAANIADSAVTSTKLATGARRPIILTPDTTEVDEETYQKLLSDDVDVVFKDVNNFCIPTLKAGNNTSLSLVFTGLSLEGDTKDNLWFYGYEVSITKDSPHNCTITQYYYDTLSNFLGLSGFIRKSTISSVLKEIDLTGTDADRKAKLDKFETDWKALTGASDLLGARFVGKVSISVSESSYITYGIFTRNNYGKYAGICQVGNSLGDDEFIPYTVWLEYDEMGCHVHADKLGTITEVMMNGVSKGTLGVVDLGTVLTEHQDISGKVDKTTLLNTLMVVDLSSTDIAVRKAALDDFKAKWLALGNTDLTGARFIGRFSDTNGNTSIHESGKFLMGEDTLLIYKQISPAFPTGFYGLSYIKDMANTLCGLYQIYVDYDTTNNTDNPGNVEITQIRDSETLDLLNRFVYGEAPSTYLKIADAESTYAKKTSIPTVNDPKVSIKMNGAEKGSFTLNQAAAGEVDLGTVITAHQDISGKQDKLISGTNIKTINGESVLGSGDITITSSGGTYPEVNHGTGDTTFTLTPNTFHVWDEVASLTLNFGNETSGVANEYLFQFTSGSTATSLTLPDDIKWANDNVPTIGANMIYQVSVLRGLASVLEFNNAKVFPIIGDTGGNANEEYAKVYEYFVRTYNLTSAPTKPSSGVIITETLICNDVKHGGRVLKVSLSGTELLLWTQNAIDRYIVPRINNLGVYSTYYWD